MKLKTTITVEAKEWKAFQLKVLENEGQARKLSAVIVELVKGYTDGRFVVKA